MISLLVSALTWAAGWSPTAQYLVWVVGIVAGRRVL